MCSNKKKIDGLILVFITNVQKLHIAICDKSFTNRLKAI